MSQIKGHLASLSNNIGHQITLLINLILQASLD